MTQHFTSTMEDVREQKQTYSGKLLESVGTSLLAEGTVLITLPHQITSFFVFRGEIYISMVREVVKYSISGVEKTILAPFSFCFVIPQYVIFAREEIYMMDEYRIRCITEPPNEIRRQICNLFVCRGFFFDCIQCRELKLHDSGDQMEVINKIARPKENNFTDLNECHDYYRSVERFEQASELARSHLGVSINCIESQLSELSLPREYFIFRKQPLLAALEFEK